MKKNYIEPVINVKIFLKNDVLMASPSWEEWPETPDIPLEGNNL